MAKEKDDCLQLMRKRGKLGRPGKIGVPGGVSYPGHFFPVRRNPAQGGPPMGMVKDKRTGQVQ